ncbi:MAG: aryldialkylphosphatase [Algoriphagus sp.]|uniref:phosphotriesterase family protein n=1 Tax=Algoriphagus sp. TaxID=1872435 RepID=UPI0026102206|nr:aryldialkylphosphatase [Algoriphagus sp.]MDG1277767.1 aryldialkylphosphatase [Algoriphagus sp.]
MNFIRTILGDIPKEQIGLTYSHEHVVIDHCFATDIHPEFLLNDFEKLKEELLELKKLELSLMIDTMPVNAGRNPVLSAKLSKETGIHLIVPTGIHQEKYYPRNHWRFQYSEDQLSDLFIADIEKGIDRYDYNGPIVERNPSHRAGMIKLATNEEPFSAHQELIFRAVVNVHLHSGAPILTHTTNGTFALEQALFFEKLGANLDHVVLSHVDRNPDSRYIEQVLDTGVSVEFDSAFRWKTPENQTYTHLETLLSKYPHQIVVGMDAARNSYWKSYGGKPGLDYLLTTFPKELKKRNLEDFYDLLFIQNPRRIFSFIQPQNS